MEKGFSLLFLIIIFSLFSIGLVSGAYYLKSVNDSSKLDGQKNRIEGYTAEPSQSPVKIITNKSPFPENSPLTIQPTASPVSSVSTYPSTKLSPLSTPSTNPSPLSTAGVNKIFYREVSGWEKYESNLGYSFQYPPKYGKVFESKDTWEDIENIQDHCNATTTRQVEGVKHIDGLAVKIFPYEGGSRRNAFIKYFQLQNHKIVGVEEVQVDGLNALIIDFKDDTNNFAWKQERGFIVVKNSIAFGVSVSEIDDNKEEWELFLGSLKLNNNFHLDISDCIKQTS